MADTTHAVSNGEFLRTIAGPLAEGEHFHVAGFLGSPATDPRWGGLRWRGTDTCPTRPEDNNYFSVAILNGPERKRSNFVRMFVLVADDPQTVPEDSTWVLQTSEGKMQLGYALVDDEQSRDPELCGRAVKAMAERGMFKADKSGNNIVRYVRLVEGTNTKYDPPFPHVLTAWHPERRFTLGEALAAFGIDINALDAEPEAELHGAPSGEVDDARIISTLMKVDPCCDYETWTRACMGVHHATSGSTRGLKAFDYWSSTAGPAHYAGAAVIKAKWASMGEYDGTPVTWASVERLAREAPKEELFADLVETHSAPPEDHEPVPFKGWAESSYALDALAPTEYLIEGFIAHSLMILAGQPGVGKTTAIAALALLAAGFQFPGCSMGTPKRRKVIYVGEDLEQMRGILYAYAKVFGLQDIPQWVILIEAHRAELDHFRRLTHNVRQHRHDGEWPWLILDTAAATLALESENDNSEVSTYLGDIKEKFFTKGVPVAFSTHTNKSVTKDTVDTTARGASAFTGDATLTATLFEDEGEHYLRLGKRRYVPDITQVRLVTHTHTETVTTRHGTTQRKTIVFVVPEASSDADRANAKEGLRVEREYVQSLKQVEELVGYLGELEQIHGPLIMKNGRGGLNTPPPELEGYVVSWSTIWEAGPVRRPRNEGALRDAVKARFESFEGWGVLRLKEEEGELW